MCTDKNLYITYDFLLQKNIYAFLHIFQIHINKFATALQHKVRTYKEYHSVCLSSKLGLPQPQTSVSPPSCCIGKRGTLAGKKNGLREFQFRRGKYTVVLFKM